MTILERVGAHAWGPVVQRALSAGERFGGAWASEHNGALVWHAVLLSRDSARVIACEAPARRVQSLVELVQAADFDEREAHDLYGLEFDGHEPMRALVEHPDDPGRWMTPVSGDGVHQIAVGPIHAGVIESGHFRFHAVGELILALDLRLFYKHRGLERAAQGRDPQDALRYVQRACAACAVANTVAFAHAVEDARGLAPDRELRITRTVLIELERVYNHLHDISAICAGVGFAAGTMAFAALKDRAQQINAAAFGHRFLFGSVAVGAGAVELDAAAAAAARAQLSEVSADATAAWRELEFAGSLQARLGGIGVLSAERAVQLGAVGPAARAAGLRDDLRSASPRLAYDGFSPAVQSQPDGDVGARLRVRAVELAASFAILDELLAAPLARGSVRAPSAQTSGPVGVGQVESARGATTCMVELEREAVGRVHLRTSSYANWPALSVATAGNLVPDFPLINKSFELCYACVDR